MLERLLVRIPAVDKAVGNALVEVDGCFRSMWVGKITIHGWDSGDAGDYFKDAILDNLSQYPLISIAGLVGGRAIRALIHASLRYQHLVRWVSNALLSYLVQDSPS